MKIMKRWVSSVFCVILSICLFSSLVNAEALGDIERVLYLELALHPEDYHGRMIEITLPVDSISSRGKVTCSQNIKREIEAETGDGNLQGGKPQFVTVQGTVDNSYRYSITINNAIVLYAGKDAPNEYKEALSAFEKAIVQGKIDARQEFIDSTIKVTYKDLRKHPAKYEGVPIRLKVKITKVDADGFFFNGAITAELDDKKICIADYREIRDPRFEKGDTITIYGVGNGLTTLTTYYKGTGLFGTDIGAKVKSVKEIPIVKMIYTKKDDLSMISPYATPISEDEYDMIADNIINNFNGIIDGLDN